MRMSSVPGPFGHARFGRTDAFEARSRNCRSWRILSLQGPTKNGSNGPDLVRFAQRSANVRCLRGTAAHDVKR
jgi:hypothetical protein